MTTRDDRPYKGTRPNQVLARQKRFLQAYAAHGTIKAACDASKSSRYAVSMWRHHDAEGFKERFRQAEEEFREMIHDIGLDRIKIQKPNDNPVLLITYLNAHWPEKFRRDPYYANNSAKEVMVEWKKWVKEQGKKPTGEDVTDKEQDTAKKRAVAEIEELLKRRGSY